jgi:hypothetical protein
MRLGTFLSRWLLGYPEMEVIKLFAKLRAFSLKERFL